MDWIWGTYTNLPSQFLANNNLTMKVNKRNIIMLPELETFLVAIQNFVNMNIWYKKGENERQEYIGMVERKEDLKWQTRRKQKSGLPGIYFDAKSLKAFSFLSRWGLYDRIIDWQIKKILQERGDILAIMNLDHPLQYKISLQEKSPWKVSHSFFTP